MVSQKSLINMYVTYSQSKYLIVTAIAIRNLGLERLFEDIVLISHKTEMFSLQTENYF